MKKRCTKCGNLLPATGDFFGPDSRKKDILKSWCRVCEREYHRKKYLKKKGPPVFYKRGRSLC